MIHVKNCMLVFIPVDCVKLMKVVDDGRLMGWNAFLSLKLNWRVQRKNCKDWKECTKSFAEVRTKKLFSWKD